MNDSTKIFLWFVAVMAILWIVRERLNKKGRT